MPIIYLDILIALNIFIDFLLLSATANILKLPQKKIRLVFGAVLGGLFSCMVFLPPMHSLLFLAIKTAAACLIVLTAFKWTGKLNYLKKLVVFLISSALFAGIASAIWFFTAPSGLYIIKGVVYYNVSPFTLTALTLFSYIILYIYDKLTHKKLAPQRSYKVTVTLSNGEITLNALYDTGHHLTDMFTGSPVIIACISEIKPLLSEGLAGKIAAMTEPQNGGIEQTEIIKSEKTAVRLIPYKSVGGMGLLPSFKPERISLSAGGYLGDSSLGMSVDITGAYLALTEILSRGEYKAIIGTDIASLFEGGR